MITRNALLGVIVLLAGLLSGYIVSRYVDRLLEREWSELPEFSSVEDMPSPYVLSLSQSYIHSKEQIQKRVDQGSDAIREAARRRQLLVQSRDRVTVDREAYEQLILQSGREVDLFRLKDYYRQFYLYYYHWLDTGDGQSAVQYKLALGQFKATLDFIRDTYKEKPVFTESELENFGHTIRMAEQNGRTIRWARVVVVILIFLLLMGFPRVIRNSGVKKFSASLYFDAIFRPHLVSDLNGWHGIRRLSAAFLLLYLFGVFLLFSFISWKIPLIIGFLGLVPVIILILLSRQRGRMATLVVSYMAPKMPVLLMISGIMALRGTGFFLYRFMDAGLFRAFFMSLLFMFVFQQIKGNIILARKWSHRSRSGSASMVWMALGFQILITGALMYICGPKESLLGLNRELMLLPPSLLADPADLLKWTMLAAGIVTTSSLLIFILNRRTMDPATRQNLG